MILATIGCFAEKYIYLNWRCVISKGWMFCANLEHKPIFHGHLGLEIKKNPLFSMKGILYLLRVFLFCFDKSFGHFIVCVSAFAEYSKAMLIPVLSYLERINIVVTQSNIWIWNSTFGVFSRFLVPLTTGGSLKLIELSGVIWRSHISYI